MKSMKKTILYLIEFLAKNPDPLVIVSYVPLIEGLEALDLHTRTRFSHEQILVLMQRQGLQAPSSVEEACRMLDDMLDQMLPQTLREAKKQLFTTLLQANFPKKKHFLNHSMSLFLSQLEPVEKSIYEALLAYVTTLNRALSLFFCLAVDDAERLSPERFVGFGETLHVRLVAVIFNEEEKALVAQGLQELLSVYLRLYGQYLYM